MNAHQDFRTMTADTIGKDILQALVMELKLLPQPWPKLPKKKQDDIIDSLRNRVESNVKMAVHLLAAEGRTVVAGDIDQITIEDGVKAESFVADMKARYAEYGRRMFISDAQQQHLERIANDE